MSEWQEGNKFEFDYPFVLEDSTIGIDEDGGVIAKSWRPGVRWEPVGPEDSDAFADGIGRQIVTVVSVHKPGRYPTRVFYTRKWKSPSGKVFGNPRLMVTTVFAKLIRGYRYRFNLTKRPETA
ncbi:MAG: hypothetical protein ACR2RF_06065 [Geminicoccaceae bacterium]